jgi:uncharacterized protein (TIRG00374 family)
MELLRKNLIPALALAVAVYFVLAVVTGLGDLSSALAELKWSLLPVIFGLVAISYVGRFLRWTYYLRLLKVDLALGNNVAIFTAGLSMTISPGKLGEVLKSVFIRRVSNTPVARTAPIVVAERATDGTGMVLWGLLGALSFSFGLWTILAFSALTVVGIAVLRSKRLSLLAERVLLKLPILNRLAPHLSDFHGASNELLAWRPLVFGTFMSFLSWGLEILAVYLCAIALGAELDFLLIVFVFAVSSIGGALSMIPGGIGVAEAGLAGMFIGLGGLAQGPAIALTFLVRLATLFFATFIGILGLISVRILIGATPPEDVSSTPS